MNSTIPSNSNKAAISIHSNPFSLVAWTSALVLLLLAAPSLSIVVFLRRQFGCRFVKLYMVAIAFGVLWTVYSFSASSFTGATPARAFALAMMGLAVYHSRSAWARFWAAGKNPKLLWHSMNDGIPRLRSLFPRVSERTLKIVLEPAATAAVAIVCVSLSRVFDGPVMTIFGSGWLLLALWLMTAALAHALFESMLYEQRLNSFIDFIDSNLEASSMLDMTPGVAGADKPSPQNTLGNPVLFTPDLFKVMEAARRRAEPQESDAFAA